MKLISDLCIRHFGLLKLRDVAASGITGSAGLGEHADEVISKLRVPQAFTVSQSQSLLFAFFESRNYRSLSHTRSELLLATLCVVCEGSGRCEALQINTSQMKSHSNRKMRKVKRHDTTN